MATVPLLPSLRDGLVTCHRFNLVTCHRTALARLPCRLWTHWTIRVIVSHLARELRRVGHVQLLVDNG